MSTMIIFALFFIIPGVSIAQTTWYVPDDFATIQEAISSDSVKDGDTVIVQPNTYVENIDFLGKAIAVLSEEGPGVTTIDGNQNGSVVTFQNQEGLDSLLEGFTITNGDALYGGGVNMKDASPIISGNTIVQNSAIFGGAGIHCDNSCPVVSWNEIIENSSTAGAGAGIRCFNSDPLILGNTICDNTLVDCGDYGGGIHCYKCSPTIMGNMISGNSTPALGGGISCYYASPEIINNIISENHVLYGGGGIHCYRSSPIIVNNTLFNNSTDNVGGGIICRHDCNIAIMNTILWNNQAPEGKEIYVGVSSYPSTVTIDYSDLKGGPASIYVEKGCIVDFGDAMLDADPLLANPAQGDYHLTWLSPCINRGINDDAPSEDLDGDPRPFMGTVDVGADEFVGTHALGADVFSVHEVTGGMVNFTLEGGLDNNGRNYLILGSITGTVPGTLLPGGIETLRLNWDVFTDFVIALIGTPVFSDFLGNLDASGTATAQLNAPPIPGFAGITMYYAYALNNPWDFVSNPVAIEIVP